MRQNVREVKNIEVWTVRLVASMRQDNRGHWQIRSPRSIRHPGMAAMPARHRAPVKPSKRSRRWRAR